MEWQRAREHGRPDELVEGVVAPDILPGSQEPPGGVEQAGRMQTARGVERLLRRSEAGRSARPAPPGRCAGRREGGRSVARCPRWTRCRRYRSWPWPRSSGAGPAPGRTGRRRWTVMVSSGRASVAGSPMLDPSMSVGSHSPSVTRNPAASSSSPPGVRIVTAMSTGACSGPAARICSGSSPARLSVRWVIVPWSMVTTGAVVARAAWSVVLTGPVPGPRARPRPGGCAAPGRAAATRRGGCTRAPGRSARRRRSPVSRSDVSRGRMAARRTARGSGRGPSSSPRHEISTSAWSASCSVSSRSTDGSTQGMSPAMTSAVGSVVDR